jgi:hypothetical protein
MEQINKLFKEAENEIASENFIALYQKVREKYPLIKVCLTPLELIRCLHNQTNPDYLCNDKILASLILEYRAPASNPIGSYLLILFKPGLLKLYSQFKERASQYPFLGDADLWLQIVTLCFEELNQLDLARDDQKIAAKIIGRIRNRLRDYFRNLFKILNAETDCQLNSELTFSEPSQMDPIQINFLLQELVALGVISETDKYILLATKVYGKSMKELSGELKEISYANIRQRRARALKAILSHYGRKIF